MKSYSRYANTWLDEVSMPFTVLGGTLGVYSLYKLQIEITGDYLLSRAAFTLWYYSYLVLLNFWPWKARGRYPSASLTINMPLRATNDASMYENSSLLFISKIN